jgi:hypothetical protein
VCVVAVDEETDRLECRYSEERKDFVILKMNTPFEVNITYAPGASSSFRRVVERFGGLSRLNCYKDVAFLAMVLNLRRTPYIEKNKGNVLFSIVPC